MVTRKPEETTVCEDAEKRVGDQNEKQNEINDDKKGPSKKR